MIFHNKTKKKVSMKGQASKLEFKLDKTELDFGAIPFTLVSYTSCKLLLPIPHQKPNPPFVLDSGKGDIYQQSRKRGMLLQHQRLAMWQLYSFSNAHDPPNNIHKITHHHHMTI